MRLIWINIILISTNYKFICLFIKEQIFDNDSLNTIEFDDDMINNPLKLKKKVPKMDTVVLKFGGSSVADNIKLNFVAEKIKEFYNNKQRVVAVVSAQGKTTDNLIKEAATLSNMPNEREMDVLLSTGEQMSMAKLSILLNRVIPMAIRNLKLSDFGPLFGILNIRIIKKRPDKTACPTEDHQYKPIISEQNSSVLPL